ncbi:acetyl-CoA carboxylase biotin carboxylase subunit [Peptacetobacter sp.]|uniref:acetyl-CoA carboxylase biotin carboxylase subunit n=1 Tax=Peptacetobacter sp. TaxID=2991975 RepID=UPI00262F10B6|nr:acetyl-CoA carboxylase biotin carboxylase subunit [Peptacetobacter sp.]
MNKIKKILIANRGDIAVRVIRTCREMGIKTVAIYSDIDKDSIHRFLADESICIGPGSNIEKSYNNIENIIYIAEKLKCDAIHPGFGFLSENPEFIKRCNEKNIIFIGPSKEQVILMGDKARAKNTMMELGVPVVPGSKGTIKNKNEAKELARKIGYPVMIKASAGGGGRGMRIAYDDIEFDKYYDIAKTEALTYFKNDDLYIEKFIKNPRHIEVQVFGDKFKNAIHFGDRDCSMQRRNQKMIEESPSRFLEKKDKEKLYDYALKIVKGISYEGAGTVEFIVDSRKNIYFIEMNTRIQVEHPVTEMIVDKDLIKLQIQIADGNEIPFKQEDINIKGHAIECRINAENPKNNFMPCPGEIEEINVPGGFGVRFDTFVYAGYKIPPVYDSMIGKLICKADTKEECIAKMNVALDELVIEGVETNIDFQKELINSNEFLKEEHNTGFIESKLNER